MPTPTPSAAAAGSASLAASTPPLTDTSLLGANKATPRSAAAAQACAVASLQALPPEVLLVLVLLDHPQLRARWFSVVVPLLESVSNRLSALHPGSRLMIGSIIYRAASESDRRTPLRTRSTIARLPFATGSKFIDAVKKKSDWLDSVAPCSSSTADHYLDLDVEPADLFNRVGAKQDGSTSKQSPEGPKASGQALEAFVGISELFETKDPGSASDLTAFAALAPQRPPVLAKHILHISTQDSILPLDLSTQPIFNQSSANDHVSISEVCSKLAQSGVSITSCGIRGSSPVDPAAPATQPSGLERIHKHLHDAANLSSDDIIVLVPAALKARFQKECFLLISGLTVASPSASRKRGRDDEETTASANGPGAVKRSKSGSISKVEPATQQPFQFPPSVNAASLSAQAAALQQKIPKLHPTVSTKIIFLKNQQEVMFRNLALIAAQVLKTENETVPKNSAPGMNRPYLEQLRNQLMAQQQGLRMLIQKVVTGSEQNPNLNICLQSLVNIDKEAKEMGVHLGGPSSVQPSANRPARSASVTSNSSNSGTNPPQPGGLAGSMGSASGGARPATSVQNGQPPAAQGSQGARPKPFWKGAISWSVISDPTTKAKREISTTVSATSNSNAIEKLLLPWPDRLQITAISQLAPRNLQIYAQSQNAPYILFSAEPTVSNDASSNGKDGGPDRNVAMYTNLAGSLDAKKSCAFIRHGTQLGSGLVLFATTQPSSSAERSAPPASVPPKLIGVLFRDPVPFNRLLMAQQTQMAQAQQMQMLQQQGAASGAAGTGTSLTASPTKSVQAPLGAGPANSAAVAAPATVHAGPHSTASNLTEPHDPNAPQTGHGPALATLTAGGPATGTNPPAGVSSLSLSNAPNPPGVPGSSGATGGSDAVQAAPIGQQPLGLGIPSAPLPTDLAGLAQFLGLRGQAGAGGAKGHGAAPSAGATGLDEAQFAQLLASQMQGQGQGQGGGGPVAPPLTAEQLRALGLFQ